MSQKVAKEATKVFSKTINSPKTAFPMYANPATREKAYLKKCTSGRTDSLNAFDVYRIVFKAVESSINTKHTNMDHTRWTSLCKWKFAYGSL